VALVLHSPEMARTLDKLLAGINPAVATYMWRAPAVPSTSTRRTSSRASNAPGPGSACRGRSHRTRPARQNLRAGIAWATTVVNMRNPEIMETSWTNQGEKDTEREEFVNGVQSSMIMRYDTSPDDPYIRAFIDHVPPGDARLARLWERDIRKTCDQAVSQMHPVLKKKQKLEEVFHFQSLTALVEKLKSA